jgi:hypothetical protein
MTWRIARPTSIGLVLLGALIGCASGTTRSSSAAAPPASAEATCARTTPFACGDKPLTYTRDIRPILERRCFDCHAGNGSEADDHNFSEFATFYVQRRAVADEIAACAMPPSPRPAVPPDEADTILSWVACGAAE